MDRNSMLYWWPKVKDNYVLKPETIIVETGYEPLIGMLEGSLLPQKTMEEIAAAAEQLGYPLFVRTDQSSGKHDWENSCFVRTPDRLMGNIRRVVEFNELADIMELHPEALVFRKYIPLQAAFKAFYGNMPVAEERRYFVRDGKAECHHPYWPEEAIEEWAKDHHHSVLPENWRKLLAAQNTELNPEIGLLTSYAEQIGRKVEGYWSVDFAKSREGSWYFIDMAEGDMSWHPECGRREN